VTKSLLVASGEALVQAKQDTATQRTMTAAC